MQQKATLQLATLLWRTRGRQWGYTFINRPTQPFADGWFDVHSQVFQDIHPGPSPTLLRGVLDLDGQRIPFDAAGFLDRKRLDERGRPAAHYLIWLHADGVGVPEDWPSRVLLACESALDAIFDLASPGDDSDAETPDVLIEEAFREHTRALNSIDVSGEGLAAPRDLGVITAKKKHRRQLPPRHPKSIGLLLLAAVIGVVALVVWWMTSQGTSPR